MLRNKRIVLSCKLSNDLGSYSLVRRQSQLKDNLHTFHEDVVPRLRTLMHYVLDDLSQLREVLRLDRSVNPLQGAFPTLARVRVFASVVDCRHASQRRCEIPRDSGRTSSL